MEYRIRETGEVMTEQQFRELHSNVSFPAAIDAQTLNGYGADEVYATPRPVVPPTQSAERNGVEFVNGQWRHAWQITDLPAEQAAVRLAAAKHEAISLNSAAIQAELDRQALAKGYDSIISACSYAAQPEGAPFQSEGAAFLNWRSAVWSHAYSVLADVEAGNIPMPTPEEAVAQMPALVLP
jgi:hypothetical protein